MPRIVWAAPSPSIPPRSKSSATTKPIVSSAALIALPMLCPKKSEPVRSNRCRVASTRSFRPGRGLPGRPAHNAVISNGAGRRLLLPFHSCEMVGLRSEKSLLALYGLSRTVAKLGQKDLARQSCNEDQKKHKQDHHKQNPCMIPRNNH